MVTVELTPEEALAWQQCGQASSEAEAKNFMLLKLVFAGGMAQAQAEELAGKVAAAFESARCKIEEATRFEIKVVE